MSSNKFFATCARGLEPILAQELTQLAAEAVQPGRGGVDFMGTQETLYKANLWLRTAIRVLQPVLDAAVQSTDELYQAVQTIDWARYLTPEHTLAVDCNVRDSRITHSQYAARRVKDAICDQFLAGCGRRPSVDPENPMVPLNLHIYKNQAKLSLESSGESLHKRGYRPIQTKAPLNEALAAGLILRTGWSKDTPFIDPMCGSGTLPIEAAWIALGRPPGLTRRHFAFQGWLDFNVQLWTQIRDEGRRQVLKSLPAPITGFDLRRDAVEFAHANARAAGIGHLLSFEQKDLVDFQPPPAAPGTILCNPPYGERIGEERELEPLYRHLGKVLGRCNGWSVFVFTGNAELARRIDLPIVQRVPFWNGRIPCQLLQFATGG
jgi:23S rRNA (guanine2445-N2)-methyltransferase